MASARLMAIAALTACASTQGSLNAAPPGDQPPRDLPEDRIEFRIQTKHGTGPVRCALYDEEKKWLTSKYVYHATAQVRGKLAMCVFTKVAPGTYSGSAYHDKNDNGKLDKNFIGLPSEDFAFTNGAKAGLGPPSFKSANIMYSGTGVLTTSGKM